MSRFFLRTRHLLAKYGKAVEVKVWSYDKIKDNDHTDELFGDDELTSLDLSKVQPEVLHEPVFPNSSHDAQLASIINGGTQFQGDLLWLSNNDYPKNSIVKVSTQEGTYKITGKSAWRGYSDYIAYELKGDDTHNDDTDKQ